ncbi:MAG: hypothetical protein L6V95_09570 [Candidatus Melainabacteria bacterium]|nr:MAG: hypothetical protein L6V95_09570 [Candidatus Melainabacteria bacterium]
MKVEKLNYTLNTNNKQQITKQKGFGNNAQTQMELPKQSWETSGSVGITDKKCQFLCEMCILVEKCQKHQKLHTLLYRLVEIIKPTNSYNC